MPVSRQTSLPTLAPSTTLDSSSKALFQFISPPLCYRASKQRVQHSPVFTLQIPLMKPKPFPTQFIKMQLRKQQVMFVKCRGEGEITSPCCCVCSNSFCCQKFNFKHLFAFLFNLVHVSHVCSCHLSKVSRSFPVKRTHECTHTHTHAKRTPPRLLLCRICTFTNLPL